MDSSSSASPAAAAEAAAADSAAAPDRYTFSPRLQWQPEVEEYFASAYGRDHFARISQALASYILQRSPFQVQGKATRVGWRVRGIGERRRASSTRAEWGKLRPRLFAGEETLESLRKNATYQRRMFDQAVKLVRPGEVYHKSRRK